MTTETQNDYDVTNVYTNIVATIAGIASANTYIQNIGGTLVSVVSQPSGPAPTGKTGVVLRPGEQYPVNAAQVWVKAFGAAGKVSVEKF